MTFFILNEFHPKWNHETEPDCDKFFCMLYKLEITMFSTRTVVPTQDCSVPHIAVIETDVELEEMSLHVGECFINTVRNVPPGQHQIPTSSLGKMLSPFREVSVSTRSKTPATVSVQLTKLPRAYRASEQRGEVICTQYHVINTEYLERRQVNGQRAAECTLFLNHPVNRIDVECAGLTGCQLSLLITCADGTAQQLPEPKQVTFATTAKNGVAAIFFPDPVNFSTVERARLALFGDVAGECRITAFSSNFVDADGLRFQY